MGDKTLCEYPRLDLSPLLGSGKFVVYCRTVYEAECLLAEMKRSYPDKCTRWDFPHVNWYDTSDEGQLYFPDINNAENIQYCWNSVDYSEINEYTVVECNSLFMDYVEISESDMPIIALVGGVE